MTPAFQPEHPEIDASMWGQIDDIITENRAIAGSVIAVLRKCQDIVGYLPVELMEYIAVGMNLARSDVFGVASFYSLFSFEPKGRHTVKVCTGTACYVKGIKEVIARISNEFDLEEGETSLDRRFSLEGVRCLGACGLAPVMVVDDEYEPNITASKIDKLLKKIEKN